MANVLQDQIYEQFKGIRQRNGITHSGQISAITAKNIEFFKTDIGNSTGIRTTQGNKTLFNLPEGYKAVKIFDSKQDNISYLMIYGENDTNGALFYIDLFGNLNTLKDDLSLTGQANGLTMQYGEYDVFIFTNGQEAYSVNIITSEVRKIEAVDNKDRTIKWLAMDDWNGQLYVASQYGVHFSHKNDIYTWNDVVNGVEDSGYIEYGRRVTALKSFTNGMLIFTQDDITHLNTTPNDTENALLRNVAMNGCFSYESLVVHDTYLFFYDHKQKNIFYMQITDTGQTRPTGPVAQEIQSFFDGEIQKFSLHSCVYNTFNEIWMLVDDKILIYDYNQQEFTQRDMPEINSICMYRNRVFSCNNLGEIRQEKVTELYDGEFKPSEYKTSFINMGSSSNLKKQKTPILLVLQEDHINSFYVEVTADFKAKNPKKILVKVANTGVWAIEDESVPVGYESLFDIATWGEEDFYARRVVSISTPNTWYSISIRFFTKEEGDAFSIMSMEFKRMKEKTKTQGR